MDSNNWRIKRNPPDELLPATENAQSWRRPYQQRQDHNNRSNRPPSSPFPNQRLINADTPQKSPPNHQDSQRQWPAKTIRTPLNKEAADLAIEAGRRIYVGNMPYSATVKDVESLFEEILEGIRGISMSVDPMTGRNPSYCFVDFGSREVAEDAMGRFNGREFMGRVLAVRPGVKAGGGGGGGNSRSSQGGLGNGFATIANRKLNDTYDGNGSDAPLFDRWRRLEPPEHVNTAAQECRRLWVGSLPRFASQTDSSLQIRQLFASYNFKPQVISKVVSNHSPSMKYKSGNHNYCFVDLASAAEAEAATHVLDGLSRWGDKLKVNIARAGFSGKLAERRRLLVGDLPALGISQVDLEAGMRVFFRGFAVEKVSELFFAPPPPPPSSSNREEEEGKEREGGGNRCYYCFVELETAEDADDAREKLDGAEIWGVRVRVEAATSTSKPVGGWAASVVPTF